jgi:hypothetical protein
LKKIKNYPNNNLILKTMKYIFTTFCCLIIAITIFAQSPVSFKYQAVVRNYEGLVLEEETISMRISIIQASIDGTPICVETFNPTTNGFGLVNLMIGSQNTTDFTTIDWSAGPYFVKIEIDLADEGNYTEMGTTQLLSVPYALYAEKVRDAGIDGTETSFDDWDKDISDDFDGDYNDLTNTPIIPTVPENVSEFINDAVYLTEYLETDPEFIAWDKSTGISITESQISNLGTYVETETDPIYTLSEASNITSTDITNLSNLSGTNTGDQDLSILATKVALGDSISIIRNEIPVLADGSETKVTAGTNVTITGSGTTASPYIVNATEATTLSIGQSYQGGIIFWLDITGQHGLLAATEDQNIDMQWSGGGEISAIRSGIGAGIYNTELIIASQGAGNYAAQLCANYQGGEYGDWYLPSQYELHLLYLQQEAVGGFSEDFYWSSTEYNDIAAWGHYFGQNTEIYNAKYYSEYVRAIRAF